MADNINSYPLGDNNSPFAPIDNIKVANSSNYSLDTNLVYPSELQNPLLKRSYIIFYINVHSDTKFTNTSHLHDVVTVKNSQRISNNLGSSITNINTGATELVNNAVNWLTNTTLIEKGTGNDISSTITKYSGKINDVVKDVTRPLKRLAGSIMLYMPGDISTNYNMNYNATPMGVMGTLAKEGKDGDFAKQVMNSLPRLFANVGANMITAGLEAAASTLKQDASMIGSAKGILNAATHTTFNPRQEQLFGDVNFRQFPYHFEFSARNAQECETIINIINTLKFHMHPEIDSIAAYYKFPSEFDIEYHTYDGQENPYLNRILSCALQDMSITYSQGSWSSLKNGMPTRLSIDLLFKELQPLNKNLIAEGGF